MDLRFVALSEIDLDDSVFEIRKFADSTRLRESLARFGILDPPWLRGGCDGHTVIDGFQRLCWAKENGAPGVVCHIFPGNSDVRDLWMRRIEKKIFEREPNLAEKAQIISALAGLFEVDEIPRSLLSNLNLANRPEVLSRWALLSNTGTETLKMLASGAISERAAIEVAGWDQRSRDAVFSVILELRCSASIQSEMVERISEIAIREEKTCADIIETPPVREILSSKVLNHRQKTQALREFLAELRQPRLSSRRKRFQREVASLGLPPGVKILAPEAFEGNNWRMELRFTGPEELRKIFRSTGSLLESDRLDTIFRKR